MLVHTNPPSKRTPPFNNQMTRRPMKQSTTQSHKTVLNFHNSKAQIRTLKPNQWPNNLFRVSITKTFTNTPSTKIPNSDTHPFPSSARSYPHTFRRSNHLSSILPITNKPNNAQKSNINSQPWFPHSLPQSFAHDSLYPSQISTTTEIINTKPTTQIIIIIIIF